MTFAAQVAADPDGSTPAQTESWADLKAAYRLMDEEDLTFAALATPHLEAITGLLSVVAIRLLQLRSVARAEPERPAAEVVPPLWLATLQQLRRRAEIVSVHHFFRQLAGLGGFLNRKSDGEPGWMALWKSFEKTTTRHTRHWTISTKMWVTMSLGIRCIDDHQ